MRTKTCPPVSSIALLSLLLSLCAAPFENVEAASLTARGNEPGWQIKISGEAINFRALDGEAFTIAPVPRPARQDGTDTYRATVGGRQFALAITDAVCVDTMTGMPHPQTATVALGDRRLAGCAGEPAKLLHGSWFVEKINGKTNVEKSEPTLTFEPDGRIHGNGSCNRFFGSFTLTGEGLTIAETGASRMMCDQPLMSQERNLLKALGATHRFELAQTGQIRLLDAKGHNLISLRK